MSFGKGNSHTDEPTTPRRQEKPFWKCGQRDRQTTAFTSVVRKEATSVVAVGAFTMVITIFMRGIDEERH